MSDYALHNQNPELFEQALVEHLERMRLTIACVVRRLFLPAHAYPDRQWAMTLAERALNQLVKRKRAIEIECPGRTRPKLYLPAGSRQGEAAIGYDLGTLWATLVRPLPRYRLTNEELRDLLDPCPYKNIRHVIEPTAEIEGNQVTGIIYRIYPTSAELKEVIRSIKKAVKDAKKLMPKLVENGDYGILVLAETRSKVKAIEKELNRTDDRGRSIAQSARIVIEYAPKPETLSKALKELSL